MAIIPADVSIDMQIEQGLGPVAAIVATNDTTLAYGRGWDVYKGNAGRLSIGATLRAVYRLYVNKNEVAAEYALDDAIFNKSDTDEGFGVDGDLGRSSRNQHDFCGADQRPDRAQRRSRGLAALYPAFHSLFEHRGSACQQRDS